MSSDCRSACRACLALALCMGCRDVETNFLGQIGTQELRLLPEDTVLHSIRDLSVAPDGHIWVLSAYEPFISVYSESGTVIRRLARRGGGPGELQYPWSIDIAIDSTRVPYAHVWDVGARRITIYTLDGKVVRTHPVLMSGHPVVEGIERIAFGWPRRLRALGAGYVLQDESRTIAFPADLAFSFLLRLDANGKVVDTLVDYRTRFEAGINAMGNARALTPIPLWAKCPTQQLAVLDPFGYTVTWYGADGDSLRADSLRLRRQEVTESDIRTWVRHWVLEDHRSRRLTIQEGRVSRLVIRHASFRPAFGTVAPPAVDMICDASGNLWLQQFDTGEDPVGRSTEWIVASRRELSKVQLPAGFQPYVIESHRAVGVHTDSLGVQRVGLVGFVGTLTTASNGRRLAFQLQRTVVGRGQ